MARIMYCPFLIADYKDKKGRLKLSCEHGKLIFKDNEGFDEFVSGFCGHAENWTECKLAKSLMRYYDRKEREDETGKDEAEG